MLKVRFQRVGKKHQPSFRLVVMPHRVKAKGKYTEKLGSYDPRAHRSTVKAERVQYWVGQGAQVSDTAYNFLVRAGVFPGPKRKISIRPRKQKKEKPSDVKDQQEKPREKEAASTPTASQKAKKTEAAQEKEGVAASEKKEAVNEKEKDS